MIPSIRFLRIRLALGQRACNRFSVYANMQHHGAKDSYNSPSSVIDDKWRKCKASSSCKYMVAGYEALGWLP